MGILNVTPDSFSDGGEHEGLDAALAHARHMIAEGADIIDIGGESTRPGAAEVSLEEERRRTIPVIEALRAESDIAISIDTSKPELMREAAAAGADLINDVRALREPGALEAAADTGLAVCLMHMQGEPRSMQLDPHYRDVVAEVAAFLVERREACERHGIPASAILLDPGFGFGKTLEHNLRLLANLPVIAEAGHLLTGLSRKRMFAAILGDDTADRTVASVTAAMRCVAGGAVMIRVHDVRETVDALKVWLAVEEASVQASAAR
ncbi:MAG: dihydropteroate synthase [Gammaproteobacteria bacterium]|nr:MAG: dihydropteroate synthase [Gammaproteobacteria bacterium]PIE34896.1 MAG: dihydropteroate synthase [Gammaproteobacteria bacterium]